VSSFPSSSALIHDAHEDGLEVPGFRDRGMNRMIRRLAADLHDLREAIESPGAALDRADQRVQAQVIRARAGDEDAVALEYLHRQLIEALIGRLPFRNVFLALDECGRIDDDHVEATALGNQGFEHIEGIAAHDLRLQRDRKSTRLNSSHVKNSYAVFCLKKKIWQLYHLQQKTMYQVQQHNPFRRS